MTTPTSTYASSPDAQKHLAAASVFIFGSHLGYPPHQRLQNSHSEGGWTFVPSDFHAREGALKLQVEKDAPLNLHWTLLQNGEYEVSCGLPFDVRTFDQSEVLTPDEFARTSSTGLRRTCHAGELVATTCKLAVAAAKLREALAG
jgi:hypothetical protein